MLTRIAELSTEDRDAMFSLMDAHFAGVTRERFEEDLDEKDGAIVLRESGIVGFTTLKRLDAELFGEPFAAVFSGDTIVSESARSSPELARRWARVVFDLRATVPPTRRLFWFLLSSGYRTYRFLPVFFRAFVPDDVERPELARRLALLARRRYGAGFDEASGVVRLPHPAPLRPGVGDILPALLRDPHVRRFVERNPGHAAGDELACLAEIHPENLTRAGRRMLR